ncbi:MAG: sarcosine oxidase subunit gamma [Silicimonas sp.]|nr:sarcosine oxidase subunit gamma [Silicimonas sp.]
MAYDVEILRLSPFALFDLKGAAEALEDWAPELSGLPGDPNALARNGEVLHCHVGPQHWLLRAPLEEENRLDAALRPNTAPPEISLVRVSDTLTFFRLTGPDAGEVLSIGCPLDLLPGVFGDTAVSFTELFGLKALVLRCAGGFEIAVEQSYGDMIADYLARATV